MLPREAAELLRKITSLPEHEFWFDDVSLNDAMQNRAILGHRQITDAYLLALAGAHGGTVATLDRGLRILAEGSGEAVELLGSLPHPE